MKSASGYYLNVYEEYGVDIFIIFNEANTEPTTAEFTAIESVITREVAEAKKSKMDYPVLKKKIESAIEDLNLDCIAFGFQVIKGHSGV